MDYCVSEVFPSSAINDAVLIPSFYEEHDALALAKGNQLVIYMVEDGFVSEPKSYEIFGVIEKLIPICYSNSYSSNLLVILTDLRSCILQSDKFDSNHLKTVSVGTLQNSWNSGRVPIKYALHPTCLIIQLENYQLDLFPINSDCTLGSSFKIDVGRKGIIDFQFIGPTSKVTRLVVLTEEYQKPQTVHLYDIDLANRTFSLVSTFDVELNDGYFMIPYDLESHSMSIVFSFNKATRVMYDELNPHTTTATICTLNKLVKMSALTTEFHLAIDSANKLLAVNIKDAGDVNFIEIGNVPPPSELVAITSNLAFVSSNKNDSIFLTITQENTTYKPSIFDTIKSTGQIINFREFGNSIISLYERAVVESRLICEFSPFKEVECPGFLRVFSFFFDGKGLNCFAFSDEESTAIIGENLDAEDIDISEMFDTSSQTFEFFSIGNDHFVQVTSSKIYLYAYKNDGSDTIENLCTKFNIGSARVTKVAHFGSKIAVVVDDNCVYFYDIISPEPKKAESEKSSLNEGEGFVNEDKKEDGGNDNCVENEDKNEDGGNDNCDENEDKNENGGNDNCDENEDKNENGKSDETDIFSGYGIKKRDQIISKHDRISSVAISSGFLAISCLNPDKVHIYRLQDENYEYVNSVQIGPIVDLVFHNHYFYALSPSDKITLIPPNLSTLSTLDCPGSHSSLRSIDNKFIIVAGPDPHVIFSGDKIYPLKTKAQVIDTTFSEGHVNILTSESLLFGSLSNPFYMNQTYSTPSKLLDVIKFGPVDVFVRMNTDKIVAFYSCLSPGCDKICFESSQDETEKCVFGGLKKKEKYIGHITFNNFLILASDNRILVFRLNSNEFVYNNSRVFQKQIHKIGTFRNYFYLQFCEEIQFFYPSSFFSENSTSSFQPAFSTSCNARIMFSDFSNQMIAYSYSKRNIRIFSFDDYNERIVPFPLEYKSSETITSLAILNEAVIFGTKYGHIMALDLILDAPSGNLMSTSEITVKEGFSTDEMITKMVSLKNNSFVMTAGINGMALRIQKLPNKKHPKFFGLYKILSRKLLSVGSFNKEFQRAPKNKDKLIASMQMCDMDLLKNFAELSLDDKRAILADEDISVELANEILEFESI